MDVLPIFVDIETFGLNGDYGVVLCGVTMKYGQEPIVHRIDILDGQIGACDRATVESIAEEMENALFYVAHNGLNFDRKVLNTRLLIQGLAPLNPHIKIIDPVQVARKHLAMSSNRLESLQLAFQIPEEKTKLNPHLWRAAALDHSVAALDEIVEHCRLDVVVLAKVLEPLLPLVGRINEWGSA